MIENDQNKTDKLFHDALADWEAQPSPAIWDKVEAALDGEGKRAVAWWWWVGGILALLISLGAAWYFYPSKQAPREYYVSSLFSENSLKSAGDSSLVINYRSHAVLPDSLKLDLQKQVDSLNSSTPTNSNKVPIQQNSASASQPNSSHNSTSSVHSTPMAVTSPVNTSPRTKPNVNSPIAVKAKNTSVKKDSTFISALPANNKQQYTTTSIKETKKPAVSSTENSKTTTATKKPLADSAAKKTQPATSTTVKANTKSKADSSTTKNQGATATITATPKPNVTNTEAKKDPVKDSASAKQNALAITKKNDSIQNVNQITANKTQQVKTDSLKNDSIVKATKKDSATKATAQVKDSTHPLLIPDLFTLSIYYSPLIARNDVTTNNSKFNIQNVKANNRYLIGAKLGFNLSSKFVLTAGLAYSQYNQTLSPDTVSFSRYINQPFIFNTSLGNMSVSAATMLQGFNPAPFITTLHTKYQYSQTIHYINMPITAQLRFGIGKLKTYITAGVNMEYAISSGGTLDLLKETETDRTTYTSLDVNKFNISTTAGVGIEYALKKHLSAFLEPNANLNLLSISSSAKSLNYNLGCLGGIKIGL